jgi:hypothetical protein
MGWSPPGARPDTDGTAKTCASPGAVIVTSPATNRPRLARDHYIRLDSNDYSVHPAAIGRRVEVSADLARVRVLCDGQVAADHGRSWAWHQSISDPAHVAAARAVRRDRVTALRRPPPRCRSARWPTMTPRSGWTGAWRDGFLAACLQREVAVFLLMNAISAVVSRAAVFAGGAPTRAAWVPSAPG